LTIDFFCFIQIPKEGLANLFNKAGPLEFAKIIPQKDITLHYTYGFVRFKLKADAAKANEMFNGYKLGDQHLRTRISASRSNNNNGISTNSGISHDALTNKARPGPSQLVTNGDESWEDMIIEKGSSRPSSRTRAPAEPPRGRSVFHEGQIASSVASAAEETT
jgi:RNA recognition motif-containing protein